ncbi:MAG: hypothetical protein HKM93_03155 [Desulfobacteraceae bacterium]|nr:hypothetical protein [Desulfobacteraceae bacterium]
MYALHRQVTGKIVIVFTLLLLIPTSASSMTAEKIFEWVIRTMEIEESTPLPTIRFVDKEELHAIFRQSNQNSFQRWAEKYGSEQAEKIINTYLTEVIGLFDPKNGVVYVGDFLGTCEKQVILAHELTHYLQDRFHGTITPDSWNADTIHLMREMEAYGIDEKFENEFCGQTPTPRRITAYGSSETIGIH